MNLTGPVNLWYRLAWTKRRLPCVIVRHCKDPLDLPSAHTNVAAVEDGQDSCIL